jgi:Fe-S-cluster containining protein
VRTEVVTVADLVDRYRKTTRLVAAGAKARVAELAGPITCRPTCSYCCYAKILAPGFVGVFVYLHLRREGQWTSKLRDKLVASDRDMTVRTHRGWLMARKPCPFLEEEEFGRGTCSIYAVRPEACAITYSVSGDGAKCAIPGGNNLVTVLDNNALLPFVPLVSAVASFGGDAVTTLPASVLLAEAAIERLPRPDVASISSQIASNETFEDAFDEKFATVPDGE